MDNVASNKMQSVVRKTKKKQVKDEMDRLKQAEKKKRRLEKALATSAAIRSELEKKKQRKKEEQQRLDEEGAAIAEAVALRVLLGEDSDDESEFNFNKTWDCAGNIGGIGYVGTRGTLGCDWGNGAWSTTGFSAGLVAAQAVSALHIGDEVSVDTLVLKGRA